MTEKLTPCAECSRHVKASDAMCPFCGAPRIAASPLPTAPFRRLAAAAAVASAAALAGCSDKASAPSADTADASDDGGGPSGVPFYGIACPPEGCWPERDASADGGDGGRASRDSGSTADASGDGGSFGDASGDAGDAGDAG